MNKVKIMITGQSVRTVSFLKNEILAGLTLRLSDAPWIHKHPNNWHPHKVDFWFADGLPVTNRIILKDGMVLAGSSEFRTSIRPRVSLWVRGPKRRAVPFSRGEHLGAFLRRISTNASPTIHAQRLCLNGHEINNPDAVLLEHGMRIEVELRDEDLFAASAKAKEARVTIDPKEAQAYLDKLDMPLSQATVERYAKQMMEGGWSVTKRPEVKVMITARAPRTFTLIPFETLRRFVERISSDDFPVSKAADWYVGSEKVDDLNLSLRDGMVLFGIPRVQ